MLIGFKTFVRKRRKARLHHDSLAGQLRGMLTVLVCILILHVLAMIYLEELSINDAIWLTMTSATTVGYGDLSAQTTGGRIVTIILLYVGGIAILAQVAAMYFEYRQEIKRRMLTGDWSWTMENHIVFLNCPDEVDEEYFYHAISGLRNSTKAAANLSIIIVSDHFKGGLPDRLRTLDVVHVNKTLSDDAALSCANVTKAHTVILLSQDHLDPTSDSINFALVDRLREIGVKARIIAEVVKDENRARLKRIGADNVLRPIRAYPEMLTRAILAPGSEQVIETLFDSCDEECIRYEVAVESNWSTIMNKFTTQDLGIPIAFENENREIISVPSSKDFIKTRALYVIVNNGRAQTDKEIEALLQI